MRIPLRTRPRHACPYQRWPKGTRPCLCTRALAVPHRSNSSKLAVRSVQNISFLTEIDSDHDKYVGLAIYVIIMLPGALSGKGCSRNENFGFAVEGQDTGHQGRGRREGVSAIQDPCRQSDSRATGVGFFHDSMSYSPATNICVHGHSRFRRSASP